MFFIGNQLIMCFKCVFFTILKEVKEMSDKISNFNLFKHFKKSFFLINLINLEFSGDFKRIEF